MSVPISQMWTVSSYVLRQKLAGRKQYPLVLMLEPLFRCNLACAGCGKIQYPAHILKKDLTPEECFRAVDECGAPMVSIPGGEPLMHAQIGEIVAGLVARKKYIYLCTNALLLKEKIHLFTPSKYLTFSVHLDGQREEHDLAVCREGGYDIAVDAVKEALRRGFRVTTNTTLFDGANPKSVRAFFDEMMDLGVEGMMLSPGYSYDKAPDQKHFLGRARTRRMFRADLQRVWMAEALLPPSGWLRRYVCRVAGDDGVAELWNGVGQSGVRQLHGTQRIRGFGGACDFQFAGRIFGDGEGNAVYRLSRSGSVADAGRTNGADASAGADYDEQ